MSDIRARRTAVLAAAAKAKSETKAQAADQAPCATTMFANPFSLAYAASFSRGSPGRRDERQGVRGQTLAMKGTA